MTLAGGEKSAAQSDSHLIDTIRFQPWELVTAVAWSPDRHLIGIAAGNHIYIYAAIDLTIVSKIEILSGALTPALKFQPDGNYLAAGSGDGYLRIWSTADLQLHNEIQQKSQFEKWVIDAHRKGVNSLDFSPDGRWLASAGNDGMVRLWDLFKDKPVREIIGGAYAIPSIDFSPDGKTVALVNSEVLRLRETASGLISGTLFTEAPLFCVAYHPDGLSLVTGDHDNTIRIWDVRQVMRSSVDSIPDPVALIGHNGKPGSASSLVWQVVFSPDGRWLASAGGDNSVRIWDMEQKKLAGTFLGHSAPVTGLSFSPDGAAIISGSLDGTAKIWNIERSGDL